MRKSMKPGTLRTVKVSLSVVSSAVLALSAPLIAYAAEWDIVDGDILVNKIGDADQMVRQGSRNEADPNPTITGTSDQNMVYIYATGGATATVTFKDLNITGIDDGSSSGNAVRMTDLHDQNSIGNVSIELEGNNNLTGAARCAAIGDEVGGTLTIKDVDNDGTLIATGGAARYSSYDGGAGIGGGYNDNANNIVIEGGTITTIGGPGAAGIGGGEIIDQGNSGTRSFNNNVTIKGGTVTAVGGQGAAGIGAGSHGNAGNIRITESAQVSVSGYTTITPNTNGLYDSGYVKIYSPGTSAESMATTDPTSTTIGTVPTPGHTDPENTDPENTDPVDFDPIVPGPAVPKPVVAGVAVDMSYQRVEESTSSAPGDKDAAFASAVEMQIDDLTREINALIAEGRLDEVNTLIKKGFKINAGINRCLTRATLEKLGELSRLGVPITIDFKYEGADYNFTIPGNSTIDPSALIDLNGVCGFVNLMNCFK